VLAYDFIVIEEYSDFIGRRVFS